MNIKELIIDYQTLVAILTFFAGLIGFYYRLKTEFAIGIAKIDMAVEEIKKDRNEKWKNQDIKCGERKVDYEKMANGQKEKDEKMEAYIADVLKTVNNLSNALETKFNSLDKKTERIVNDIDWIKKRK